MTKDLHHLTFVADHLCYFKWR